MAYWMERAGLGFLVAGLVALVSLFDVIDGRLYVSLAVAWGVLLAGMALAGSLPLIGPVLAYDLIRLGRRRNHFWIRTLFVLLLGGTAAFLYHLQTVAWNSVHLGFIPLKAQAAFGQNLFFCVILLQFILVGALTPGYVAGAIAEEKERGTLEFLLATDLRGHEIVFGKLIGRVANLWMFVLASLPVMAIALLFGGVEPNLLLVCYGASLVSVLGLAGVAVFASVRKRRARDAITLAYLLVILYLIASFLPFLILDRPARMNAVYDVFGWKIKPSTWANLFAAGNPFRQAVRYNALAGSRGGGAALLLSFRNYAVFHGSLFVLLIGYSSWKLRSLALSQAHVPVRRSGKKRELRTHPSMEELPVLWKELHVRGGAGTRLRMIGILLACLAPPGLFLWGPVLNPVRFGSPGWFADVMQHYTRYVGVLATSLLYLRIAVRGAGCISGERDRHSLDTLLTTPLSLPTILLHKWIGCVLGVWGHWFFLVCTWLVGACSGGINLLMVIPLLATALLYAVAFAGLGIFCSLRARTTSRAIFASIAGSLFMGGGFVLVFRVLFSVVPWTRLFSSFTQPEKIDYFAGFAPPVTTYFLSIREFIEGWRNLNSITDSGVDFASSILVGLVVFSWISIGFWRISLRRFARLANRPAYLPYERRKRRLGPK